MDFFELQDQARRRSTLLVVLFAIAVVLIITVLYLVATVIFQQGSQYAASRSPGGSPVTQPGFWNPQLLLAVGGGTLVIIALGSLYKVAQLRGGGRVVAESLGGRLLSPDTTDPVDFAKRLNAVGRKYNNALVGVESNGVGVATLALLEEMNYPNLYYEKAYKPGIASTVKSVPQMLSYLQDALMDYMVLNDEDTVGQLGSYREDKSTERSASSELLGSATKGKRRDRHHWDKVSALQLACVVARAAPRRYKQDQKPAELDNVVLFRDMTYEQLQEYRKAGNKSNKRRVRARYPRRRR